MKYLFMLVFTCCIVLGACSENSPQGPNETKHLGVLLFGDSRIPQSQGLLDGLKSFGFEEGKNLKITLLNAKNNKKQLAPMVDQLVDAKVDVLVAGGGLEAEAIKSNAKKQLMPTLVLYINAIIERQFIEDRRKPGWEVTGIDNLNFELSGKRVVLLRDLVPSIKKILVLYFPNIKPSALGVEAAKAQASKLGITIDARAVNSRDDINNIMSSLQPGDVDAMITVPTAPIDNAMKDIILPHVERLAVPLVTHSRKMVEAGALASYGAPFYDMGKQAARLADKILNGSKASSIPFETPVSYQFIVNEATLQRLNINISNIAASQISEYIR